MSTTVTLNATWLVIGACELGELRDFPDAWTKGIGKCVRIGPHRQCQFVGAFIGATRLDSEAEPSAYVPNENAGIPEDIIRQAVQRVALWPPRPC